MPPASRVSTQLLVIGAGATGLGIAWDACLRGLKVVVIEKGDLAQGTSGRYHGLLHSGARYAVSDSASARDCAQENGILRRIARGCIEDTGGLFLLRPSDPGDHVAPWLAACHAAGVSVEEVDPAQARRREPAVAEDLARAFLVPDAALDSFDLLHSLERSIRALGGQVWLRHSCQRFLRSAGRITGIELLDARTGTTKKVEADLVVNAAGPWAAMLAAKAGIRIPLALSKGTMLALAGRPVHTVLNRCAAPGDGDIIVPVGTVAVLGTTDTPVRRPDDVVPSASEVGVLLQAAAHLMPEVETHRPLRAWAGVRPLYRAPGMPRPTRYLPRSHHLIDHAVQDGVSGMLSIVGGKLTTFRRMAAEVVDLAAQTLGSSMDCRTADTPLEDLPRRFHTLPNRWASVEASTGSGVPPAIVCECELVTRSSLRSAIEADASADLDDLRRDLRLGMGPCQAAFCGYRAADELARSGARHGGGSLGRFLEERWRGTHMLAWGYMLRQIELHQRVSRELLGVPAGEARR